MNGVLVAFSGLPGTGKTTLARQVAAALGATYLRIDVIEQAIRSAGVLAAGIGPAGYLVGYALAEANLSLGRIVVADSVNPLHITRAAWRSAAERAGARLVDVEIVCSNAAEHRRRVEQRPGDIDGLTLPGWADVVGREYDPWDTPRLVIDTAVQGASAGVQAILAAVAQSRV